MKLTCKQMEEKEQIANVTVKEQGSQNDIIIEINGITVAWISPKGYMEIMSLSSGGESTLNALGFQTEKKYSRVCGQLRVKP